jgi:hypothetical protein
LITIQGLDYEMELVQPGLHSDFIGQTIPEDLRIMVSAGIAPQKQEEITIHEITHMLVYNEPIVMSQSHEESEGFVSRLAVSLYQMLVDNGLLEDGWLEKLVDTQPEEVVAISSNKNVTEKNVDSNPLRTEHSPDESLRRDSNDEAVLDGRQGIMARHSQQGIIKRVGGRRRPAGFSRRG